MIVDTYSSDVCNKAVYNMNDVCWHSFNNNNNDVCWQLLFKKLENKKLSAEEKATIIKVCCNVEQWSYFIQVKFSYSNILQTI